MKVSFLFGAVLINLWRNLFMSNWKSSAEIINDELSFSITRDERQYHIQGRLVSNVTTVCGIIIISGKHHFKQR